jgi:hypothetical protein
MGKFSDGFEAGIALTAFIAGGIALLWTFAQQVQP